MNREIQLHDSEVSEVTHREGSTSIILGTAYVHESPGVPGFHAGRIWDQPARLIFTGTEPVSLPGLPLWIHGGTLRIGRALHESFIPADGEWQDVTELVIILSTGNGVADGGTLTVKGSGVKIELVGERSESVEFDGSMPCRSLADEC